MRLIGQKIIDIYHFEEEDGWALLRTNEGFFELRLGGIARSPETPDENLRMKLPIEGKEILSAKTDDFNIYLELEDGSCLSHAETMINENGDTDFAVFHLSAKEFEQAKDEWYDKDDSLREIDYN